MDYALIKHMHVGMAYLSISFFIFRSILSVKESNLLQHKLIKILPHIIDTLLLLSAGCLMVIIQQYPFVNSWLTAKFIALIVYVVVGTIAIKRGKTTTIRVWASVFSIAIFVYILGVAKSHDVMSWLALA